MIELSVCNCLFEAADLISSQAGLMMRWDVNPTCKSYECGVAAERLSPPEAESAHKNLAQELTFICCSDVDKRQANADAGGGGKNYVSGLVRLEISITDFIFCLINTPRLSFLCRMTWDHLGLEIDFEKTLFRYPSRKNCIVNWKLRSRSWAAKCKALLIPSYN